MKNPKLLDRKVLYDHFFRVEEFKFAAENSEETLNRYLVERPDATAILLYNEDRYAIVLVQQFRVAALGKDDPPNLWEIPAGIIEPGEVPSETIIRETYEETGYQISNPAFINQCYASPGTFSEKFFLYYAQVNDRDRKNMGGGNDDENEHLKVVEIPVKTLYSMMDEGDIMDAKSLVALYWFRSRHSNG